MNVLFENYWKEHYSVNGKPLESCFKNYAQKFFEAGQSHPGHAVGSNKEEKHHTGHSNANDGHEWQREAYPDGALVVSISDILSPTPRGNIAAGERGAVDGHCDDGRARFLIRGEYHTFSCDPSPYLKVISTPQPPTC